MKVYSYIYYHPWRQARVLYAIAYFAAVRELEAQIRHEDHDALYCTRQPQPRGRMPTAAARAGVQVGGVLIIRTRVPGYV